MILLKAIKYARDKITNKLIRLRLLKKQENIPCG